LHHSQLLEVCAGSPRAKQRDAPNHIDSASSLSTTVHAPVALALFVAFGVPAEAARDLAAANRLAAAEDAAAARSAAIVEAKASPVSSRPTRPLPWATS
jgi:hypothetical protein